MEDQKEILQIKLTKAGLEDLNYWRTELSRWGDDREQVRDEFNGLTYTASYDECERVGEARLLAKSNDVDKKLTSGTTKNKVQTQVSALLGYNFTPEVTAYNSFDDAMMKISLVEERLLLKSREIEAFEEIRPIVYQEGSKHGTFFTEEVAEEKWFMEKKINELNVNDFSKTTWTEKKVKQPTELYTKTYTGKQVYLSNINEFFISKQDAIATVDVISRAEAESVFGKWGNWKYVGYKAEDFADLVEQSGLSEWTLTNTKKDQVEVIKVQDQTNNVYQIVLNGVPMLPKGFPLTAISPSGKITIAKGDMGSSVVNFAYSTPLPADMRVDQDTYDKFLRAMVVKTEQSIEPPLGTKADKRLNTNIFTPGTIIPGLKEGDVFKLLPDSNGVSPSEINMFKLLGEIMDDKSLDPSFAGGDTGNITATQYEGEIRQQKMKLGSSILGVINWHKQSAWLRLQNINSVWTEKVDYEIKDGEAKNVYRRFTVDTPEDNDFDRSLIIFDEGTYKDEDILNAQSKMKGTKLELIKPAKLRELKASFKINIIAKANDSTELEKTMLLQNTGALAEFGIMPNPSSLAKTYCNMARLPYEELYGGMENRQQPQQQQQGNSPQQSQMKPKQQQPSVNTLNV